MLTSSIAMCTYNGIKYLRKQLDSLANQTQQPDEIIICDDGSNDGTREFLLEYQKTSPLPIVLRFNETNLGFFRNFEQSARLCTKDIVFFCDQDDLWLPEKIERFMNEFQNPDVGIVLSDADLMDGNGNLQNIRLTESWGIDYRRCERVMNHNALDFVMQYTTWPGMSMAYQNRFSEVLFPYLTNAAHDIWTLRLVGCLGAGRFLTTPLVHYRIHETNALGTEVVKRTIFNSISYARRPIHTTLNREYAADMEQILIRMSVFPNYFTPVILRANEQKRLHHLNRYLLRTRQKNKWLGILIETLTGRYFWYGKGIKNIGMDVLS